MKKIENYWPSLKKCPLCSGMNRNNRSYYECKDPDCDYVEKEYKKKSKREQRIKPIIREIINHLLTNDKDYSGTIPFTNFVPGTLLFYDPKGIIISGGGHFCQPGWYISENHTIYIPQKTLFLPNKEIIEVVSHETAHVPMDPKDNTKGGHTEKFHHKYMDYRKEAFSQFSWFAQEKEDDEVRYTINFNKEFYKKVYGYDLEDLKIKKSDYIYNPYEDN